MLANFVLETVSAPGTTVTVNLAGAPTGRRTWAAAFSTGTVCYYVMNDGTQAEWGYGTLVTGTPNTFSRDTVIKNSAGTTARVNFTSTTRIFCDLPAERTVYVDANGNVSTPGDLYVTGNAYLNVNNRYLRGRDTGGTTRPLVGVDNGNYNVLFSAGTGLRIANAATTSTLFAMSDAGAATFYASGWQIRNTSGSATYVDVSSGGQATFYNAGGWRVLNAAGSSAYMTIASGGLITFYDGAGWQIRNGDGSSLYQNVAASGAATIYNFAGWQITNSAGTLVYVNVATAGDVSFGTASTSCIGTQTPGWHFAPGGGTEAYSGDTPLYLGSGSGNLITFFYGSSPVSGISTNGATVSYNTTSDYRLKDITQAPVDGDSLLTVPVYVGTWKNWPDVPSQPMILAHELQAVAPEAVTGAKDATDDKGNPVYQAVDHSALIPRLLACIQSLHARISVLESGHG